MHSRPTEGGDRNREISCRTGHHSNVINGNADKPLGMLVFRCGTGQMMLELSVAAASL